MQRNGDDAKISLGAGQKINILVKELEKYKNDAGKIIFFAER